MKIDLTLEKINRENILAISNLYKDYNLNFSFYSYISTNPDLNNMKEIGKFFADLNKHFKKKANSCYKIFICSGQNSEVFTLSNFNFEIFEENLNKLKYFESMLIEYSKGNPSFNIFVYFVEFIPPPSNGGVPIFDKLYLRAA